VEVVVRHGGHPPFDELDKPKGHPVLHVPLLQIALERPHVLVEPRLEVHVLGEPAEDDHRHVGVGVDEPRHGDPSAPFEHVYAGGRKRTRRCDGVDPAVADENVVVVEDLYLGRLAPDNVAIANQQVGHAGVVEHSEPGWQTVRERQADQNEKVSLSVCRTIEEWEVPARSTLVVCGWA
jgi:hypothetical protein